MNTKTTYLLFLSCVDKVAVFLIMFREHDNTLALLTQASKVRALSEGSPTGQAGRPTPALPHSKIKKDPLQKAERNLFYFSVWCIILSHHFYESISPILLSQFPNYPRAVFHIHPIHFLFLECLDFAQNC